MKVVHKGIVIVFAPLVIQVAVVLIFHFALQSAQQQIDSTTRSRDILAASDSFRRALLREGFFVYMNRCSPSTDLAHRVGECSMQLNEALERLDQLTKTDKAEQKVVIALRRRAALRMKIRKMLELMPDGMSTLTIARSPGIAADYLTGLERQAATLFDLESHRAQSLPQVVHTLGRQLIGTLVIGSLFSVFALVLGFFVAREIGKRLDSLLNNAWRLVAGAPLRPPNPGDDEIALLDNTLYQSAQDLRANEEFRQSIIAIVSHELRTPLTSLSATMTALAAGFLGTIEKGVESTLQRCAQAASKVISMISNLLDAEMIETGKLQSSNDSVNLSSAIQSSRFVIEDSATLKSVSIVSTVPPDAQVNGDTTQIVRLLEELFAIAIEHCDQGTAIEVTTADEPAFLTISYQGDAIAYANSTIESETAADLPERLRWSLCLELARTNAKKLSTQNSEGRQIIALKNARKDEAILSIRQELPVAKTVTGARSWFSLEQKWLLLLFPVLVSQCLFVATMLVLCSQIQQELESEYRSWTLVAQASKLTTAVGLLACSSVGFRMTADPVIVSRRDQYHVNARRELAALEEKLPGDSDERRLFIKHLKESMTTLERLHEKSLVSPVETGIDQLLNEAELKDLETSMKGVVDPISRLIATQTQLQGQSRNIALERRKQIEDAVAIALGFSLLMGLILLVPVTSVSGRITRLIDSSRKLPLRTQLPPVLPGDDEFAQLDKILHFIDQRFTQFESFKKETSMLMGEHLRHSLDTIHDGILDLIANAHLSDEGNDRLGRMGADCKRLIRLVDDFLNARMMEAGKFEIRIQSTQSSEIIEVATLSVEQLARKTRTEIEKPQKSFPIECDPDRIAQVLINFLSNAIKFSEPNSVVSIDAIETDQVIEFQVTDKGRGISQEVIDKLFHKYEQSEATDWHEKRGSGLGLYICKSIIEAHGGEIGVRSELGKGSTFWARVPSGSIAT